MAHTNSTANYELSQFLGTDKPAWLVDYNGDMLKIDTALKANADAEAASAEDIQELQDAIGAEGLTGRITDIENDIGDIKTEIGSVSLPTTAQSLTGAIAELKGVNDNQTQAINQNSDTIAQVGGAVEGVSQLAYTIANVYDSSATYAVGAYAIYQNTLYKCTTAINVGEPFDASKWTSVKVMSEVGQGGGGGESYTAGNGIDITSNVISFDGDTAPYDNTSSGLAATNIQGAIDEIVSDIPSLENNLGTEVNLSLQTSLANAYVAPNDGYVNLAASSSNASISVSIYGASATDTNAPHTLAHISTQYDNQTVYVRKGMKIFISSLSGGVCKFIPFA